MAKDARAIAAELSYQIRSSNFDKTLRTENGQIHHMPAVGVVSGVPSSVLLPVL